MEPPVADQADLPDELACRLKCGDRDALAVLFSEHRERLWRMVNFRMDRRLSGRVDPDDVLQEAYLAAAQRLAHYRAESAMSPYVTRWPPAFSQTARAAVQETEASWRL